MIFREVFNSTVIYPFENSRKTTDWLYTFPGSTDPSRFFRHWVFHYPQSLGISHYLNIPTTHLSPVRRLPMQTCLAKDLHESSRSGIVLSLGKNPRVAYLGTNKES